MTSNARLTEETDDVAIVEVRDEDDTDHRFAVDKATGDVVDHQCGAYPDDVESWTTAQRERARVAGEVARYATHYETDAAVVRPTDLPENVQTAMTIIEEMSDGAFVRHFQEFYGRIQDPPTDRGGRVDRIEMLLYLDDDRLEYATGPAVRIDTDHGPKRRFDNPADEMAAPDRDPEVIFSVSPGDLSVEFGDEFRAFVLDRLGQRLRELHRRSGVHTAEDDSTDPTRDGRDDDSPRDERSAEPVSD